MGGSSGERIPHPRKPRVFKVLHIHRGEIRDSEGLETEGDAEVADAAAGEIGSGGGFLKRGVEVAAAGMKAEDAPARVLAVASG